MTTHSAFVPCPDGGKCGAQNHRQGSMAYRECAANRNKRASGTSAKTPDAASQLPQSKGRVAVGSGGGRTHISQIDGSAHQEAFLVQIKEGSMKFPIGSFPSEEAAEQGIRNWAYENMLDDDPDAEMPTIREAREHIQGKYGATATTDFNSVPADYDFDGQEKSVVVKQFGSNDPIAAFGSQEEADEYAAKYTEKTGVDAYTAPTFASPADYEDARSTYGEPSSDDDDTSWLDDMPEVGDDEAMEFLGTSRESIQTSLEDLGFDLDVKEDKEPEPVKTVPKKAPAKKAAPVEKRPEPTPEPETKKEPKKAATPKAATKRKTPGKKPPRGPFERFIAQGKRNEDLTHWVADGSREHKAIFKEADEDFEFVNWSGRGKTGVRKERPDDIECKNCEPKGGQRVFQESGSDFDIEDLSGNTVPVRRVKCAHCKHTWGIAG